MSWTPARDREKYGVAIYNYSGINESCIKLNVGDAVHIQEELDGWFFGYSLQNSATRGVFPKAFIQIRDCIVDKTGVVEVVSPRLPPIVQEVTAVLREWGILLRKLYLERSGNFDLLRDTMLELHALRRKVLSGQLPVDELKKIKQRITRLVDVVNAELGLDLVVRDEGGNILNPAITSAVKLFRFHFDATKKLDKKGESSKPEEGHTRRRPHLSWTILFCIKNIIIKVPEDSEISLGLYTGDPREGRERPLTESFIIPWTDGGYTHDLTFLDELKCLFTDLNTHTLDSQQVWLIGTVIRHGCMAMREMDPRRSMAAQGKKALLPSSDFLRRPYGIIAADLTEYIKKKKEAVLAGTLQTDDDANDQLYATFYLCGEKETLDLKKLLSVRGDAVKEKMGFHRIWFTLQVMNGDVKQLKEGNYVEVREVPVAYRLGLSDVIMPGDVRNDLYITLQGGEFSRGSKTSDRNVEVTARIWDEKGNVVPGVIHQGCRKGPLDDYRSVTYHHEAKPRWAETFKIALPVEEFKKAHIKFTFRHRSTNDAKDKTEKPFAMSFVKLIQKNGTTLQNTDHDLIVYKIDSKKWSETDFNYLGLPWQKLPGEEYGKVWQFGISPSPKDSFTISTTFCSTKLTQNGDLLRLLEWGWHEKQTSTELESCLLGLQRVPADELMVFLQDTLDVLLEILMNNKTGDYSDNKVFEALVYVITIATDKNKHEAFQPVLDTYIQQNFHAALAYNRLIYVLKYYVQEGEKAVDDNKKRDSQEARRAAEEARRAEAQRRAEGAKKGEEKAGKKSGEEKEMAKREEEMKEIEQQQQQEAMMRKDDWQETLKRAMKCLQYIFRFIIRSRQLFVDMNGRGQEEFEKSLQELLESMAALMKNKTASTLTVQAQCLRSITTAIPDIITNFSPVKMSHILAEMVDNLHPSRIPKQRLTTINEIVHSDLFKIPECRRVLLPCFIGHLRRLMASNDEITGTDVVMRKEKQKSKLKQILDLDKSVQLAEERKMIEELELSSKILGDILDVLFKSDIGPVYEDVGLLSLSLLEDILSVVSRMKRGDLLLGNYVSILVSLLRQMTDRHYHTFLNRYEDNKHLCGFLLELLDVIEKLVKDPVFANDWAEMILLQNHVVVKVLQQFSRIISDRLLDPFREDVWSKIFHTSIDFISQSSLQLESFTQSKRNKILGRYKDMRRETALGVKGLWFSLGVNKIKFVAGRDCLVGPFLQMTMLPDTELRKATIPIFFDMMQCEFYSTRDKTKENEAPKIKLENEMLEKLDQLVESGHGDEHYRDMFKTLIGSLCQGHATLCETGRRLVSTVTRLLDRLLQYRTIMNTPDNSAETRMGCIVNLLDFYSEIKRKELYLRYVYKLTTLHLDCDNYLEAGYSLMQHTKLLHWTPDPLSYALRSPFYLEVERHHELKEMLYEDIIGYFDKGKMWEDAVKLCKELMTHYEEVRYDYAKLSKLLTRMATFYKNIMNPQNLRPEPEYFRVAYYGRGFPAFLQNKVFVYRGNGFERLAEFSTRIQDQFPNAELMKKLTAPSEEAKESPHQYLQISKVDCAVDDEALFPGLGVSEQIRGYYRANHIRTFTYSRPFHRGTRDSNNEFATLCIEKTTLEISYSLPGILRWFPVKRVESIELSPLENALETMSQTNAELRGLVRKYERDPSLPLHQLTRKLSGIVDAAVMGGIANYEKAFLCEEYEESHPADEDKLKQLRDLIAAQVPLLEAGLLLHGCRMTKQVQGLHSHLTSTFQRMKAQVQEKYGEAEMPDDIRELIQPQRLHSLVSVGSEGGSARASQHYYSAHEGITGSQLSLSRMSMAGKGGGTLPRHMKISSTAGNGMAGKSSKEKKSIGSRLLRRESFSSQREPSTQWFDRTDAHTATHKPILEQNEHVMAPLTPLRTKRTELEVDKFFTNRPRSLTLTPSTSSSPSPSLGSRESLSTPTGSLYEEEQRPPLPIKQRDQEGADFRLSSVSLQPGNKGMLAGPFDLPDEPPEKPPRPDKNHNLHNATSSSSVV